MNQTTPTPNIPTTQLQAPLILPVHTEIAPVAPLGKTGVVRAATVGDAALSRVERRVRGDAVIVTVVDLFEFVMFEWVRRLIL